MKKTLSNASVRSMYRGKWDDMTLIVTNCDPRIVMLAEILELAGGGDEMAAAVTFGEANGGHFAHVTYDEVDGRKVYSPTGEIVVAAEAWESTKDELDGVGRSTGASRYSLEGYTDMMKYEAKIASARVAEINRQAAKPPTHIALEVGQSARRGEIVYVISSVRGRDIGITLELFETRTRIDTASIRARDGQMRMPVATFTKKVQDFMAHLDGY